MGWNNIAANNITFNIYIEKILEISNTEWH